MLPEWEPVRSRPQRNAYHRFTVDRHLWEAAANAAEHAGDVARPDLLVLGALFHDIGKGYPGDHTDVGHRDRPRARARGSGLPDARRRCAGGDGRAPPAAARRGRAARPGRSDDDPRPSPTRSVDQEVLELLHAADGRRFEGHRPVGLGRLEGGARRRTRLPGRSRRRRRRRRARRRGRCSRTPRPSSADGDRRATTSASTTDRLTVVYPDAPGAFSRIAGVVSLHGLDVVACPSALRRTAARTPQHGRLRVPRPRSCHGDRLGADPP